MKIRIDPLDKLASEYVRKRSKGYCERCGTYYGWKKLQACHMFTRRKKSTRYNPDNMVALDFGCHSYLDSNPIEKIEFFTKRLGEDKFLLLQLQAHRPEKPDIEAVTIYLKSLLRELK